MRIQVGVFIIDGDGQCGNLRQNRKTASTVSNVRCRWWSAARRRYCRQRSNGSWNIACVRSACIRVGRRPQPVSAELAAAYERIDEVARLVYCDVLAAGAGNRSRSLSIASYIAAIWNWDRTDCARSTCALQRWSMSGSTSEPALIQPIVDLDLLPTREGGRTWQRQSQARLMKSAVGAVQG